MANNVGDAAVERLWSRADRWAEKYGVDPWSKRESELKRSTKDLGNYLSSGNFTTNDTNNYRSSATKAVGDLTSEMGQYSKDSYQYKTLAAYKDFYESALGDFDRIDVGTNAIDYLTADAWYDADTTAAQREAFQTNLNTLQTEMDAIEDKESDEYKHLEGYYKWYESLLDGFDQRSKQDALFKDADDYASYQKSSDYDYYNGLINQRGKLQAERDEINYDITENGDISRRDRMDEIDKELELLDKDIARVEKWQDRAILSNYNYGEFDPAVDYKKTVDDLIDARSKATEGTAEWRAIDRQIKVLAGENEDGMTAEGYIDGNTLLGKYLLYNYDQGGARRRSREIDKELKDLGNEPLSPVWFGALPYLATGGGNIEKEKRRKELELEKRVLGKQSNDAADFRNKYEAIDAITSMPYYEKCLEEGRKRISEDGTYYINNAGHKVLLDENYKYLDDNFGADIRDNVLALIGAEALGKDITITGGRTLRAEDALRLYSDELLGIAAYKDMAWLREMKSPVAKTAVGAVTDLGLEAYNDVRHFGKDWFYTTPLRYKTDAWNEEIQDVLSSQEGAWGTVGKYAGQTASTIGHMLPSIALNAALTVATEGAYGAEAAAKIGQTAQLAYTGISSGGRSYQQKLRENWSVEDARTYGVITGAAEVATGYLIGLPGKATGLTEEALINFTKNFDSAAARFVTQQGIRIASETAEELVQNRIERALEYNLYGQGDANWMKWTDEDWDTVLVTAFSTGILDSVNSYRQTYGMEDLGARLSGEKLLTEEQEKKYTAKLESKSEFRKTLESKGVLKDNASRKLVLNEVGKMMNSSDALRYTLETIALGMDPESDAYKTAEKMQSGKLKVNNGTLGELYSEIYQAAGKTDADIVMAKVMGGAMKYNEIQRLKAEQNTAETNYKEAVKNNPDAQVLDKTASELVGKGVKRTTALEYAPLINKLLSGQDLTDAELDKLAGESDAAKAARVLLSARNEAFSADMDPALAKELLKGLPADIRAIERQQEALLQTSVLQAAMDAGNRAEVQRAAAKANLNWNTKPGTRESAVSESTAQELQKAQAERDIVDQQLAAVEATPLEKYAEVGTVGEALGAGGANMAAVDQMSRRMEEIDSRLNELRQAKTPSKAQRTEMANLREEKTELQKQVKSIGSRISEGVNAKAEAARKAEAEERKASVEARETSTEERKGEPARSNADTVTLPNGKTISRDGFVQLRLNEAKKKAAAQGKTLTEEQIEKVKAKANEDFDLMLEQTGQSKDQQQNAAKSENKKPTSKRKKLTGKVEYWKGGVLEGTNYDQVSEAEARELLGEANMAFLEKVLTKIANVTLIKSRLENGEYVGANGIFYRDGRIYLDVNAEMDFGERGIVLAAAHELTHFIAEYNSPAFLKLKDFVLNELKNKGMPLDERIKDQQARYKATTGKELSREKAEEEVVADACEMMLTDADAIKRFAAANPTEAKTILDWLTDFFNQIADAFKDLVAVHPEAKALQEQTNQIREMWLNALVEADANAAKSSIDKLSDGGQKIVESLGQDATIQVDANGDITLAQSEDGKTIAFSMKTYEDSGKRKLIQALKENGHTQEEIDAVVENIEATGDFLVKLAQQFSDSHGYNNLMNNLWAEITTNVKTGKQVISTLVNNGDYPVNLDLQLICKKRVAYMRMLTRLIDDGVFEKVDFKGSAIADLNAVLRDGGFETACLGCFVESRRLQLQAWAETIVEEWNSAVDKRNPQAGDFNFAKGGNALSNMEIAGLITELENAGKKNDKGNLNLGKGAVEEKMGRLLDKVPSLVQHLTVADLLTPQGMSTLRSYDQNLFSLVKQRYGANSPKIVQDFNAYNGEIADLSFKFVKDMIGESVKGSRQYIDQAKKTLKQRIGESKAAYNRRVETEAMRKYLYDIGGVRIQSFSDFMIENVFDYLQIVADLSAREFPLHGYSKEAIFLRLFGMTGGKFNGSLIAHVEEKMGKEYAGLLPAEEAKDGRGILVEVDGKQYAICFDDYARHVATGSFIQSIGMKDIIALQLDPRYSKNVGSITIGVSDKQILAMLDSPYFRMVIPYHASGMIPEYARLVGVSSYNDYTDYQTTKVNKCFDLDGNPVDGFWKADGKKIEIDTHYDFNEAVQRLGDAKAAANEYLEWCKQRHPVYDGKKIVGYATFTAKFSDSPYGTDFTKHENYYKLLEDFNSYDSIGEASALQGAVTMTLPSEATRLTTEQMAEYKQALRDTGLFTEKDIEKYAKKADMTFQELIAEEVGNRAEYESRQAKVWDETVDKAEKMLLEKYRREPAAKNAARASDGASFSLRNGEETALYIKNDAKRGVDFVDEIFEDRKHGETRDYGTLRQGWWGVTRGGKNGQVVGRVELGEPIQFSNDPNSEYYRPDLYADSKIEGTEYDIKPGETKWYYPIINKEDFRNNPKPVLRNGAGGAVYQRDSAEPQQAMYSSRDAQYNNWAPEFYSKMANTINEWTNGKGQPLGPKMAANQVVGWLKGKGVKSEEIKWSGIIPYLEGKKTVTKEELQQVMAENEIKIETKVLGGDQYYVESPNGKQQGIKNAYDYSEELAESLGISAESIVHNIDLRSGDITLTRNDTGEVVGELKAYDNEETKWKDYTLEGGENYREILFRLPGLTYSNEAIRMHWGSSNAGTIAHARVQDMANRNGRPVLFVEEIQSDLHNEGARSRFVESEIPKGYDVKKVKEFKRLYEKANQEYLSTDETNRLLELEAELIPGNTEYYASEYERDSARDLAKSAAQGAINRLGANTAIRLDFFNPRSVMRWMEGKSDGPLALSGFHVFNMSEEEVREEQEEAARQLLPFIEEDDRMAIQDYLKAVEDFVAKRNARDSFIEKLIGKGVPNVPFAGEADTYHEYVMKHLLRLAAEGEYNFIGWTTADQQSERWSNEFAEGYKIEYDQTLPKFMNKYVKQWGAKVGSTVLENGEEVWSVPITEEMKESVLKTGQPLFSARGNAFSRPREEVDAEYADAVAEGNEDWQKQLVAEAANAAGYTTHAYHGSPIKDITVFRTRSEVDKPQKMQLLFGTHFTTNKAFADMYARKAKNSKGTSRMTTTTGRTYGAYLDLGKSLDLRTAQNFTPGSEMYSLYEDLPENIRKKVQPREFTANETAAGIGEGKYINIGQIEDALERMTPKAATEFLVSHGFNSVLYDARYNTGSWDNNRFSRDPSIIMLDANRIKSDEPITYDNEGNIIPLSERFNRESEDIRFSTRSNTESGYPENTIQNDIYNLVKEGSVEGISAWVTEQMNKFEQTKENSKLRAPVIPSKNFVPKVTKEESAALDRANEAAGKKYGFMRKSGPEEKSNGFNLAKRNVRGQFLRRFLQNVGSTKSMQVAQDQVKKFALTDVLATYVQDSNKADLATATNTIKNLGLKKSIDMFTGKANSFRIPTDVTQTIALGNQLMIETAKEGDMRSMLDVMTSLALLGTQAGKTVQAFSMLKKAGPLAELYYVQKAVNQLNEKYAGQIEKGKMSTITVSEEDCNAVLAATDEESRDEAIDTLIKHVGEQVPVTLKERWDAWRYLAMLGNARTHIRNVVGNAVFVPLRFTKNLLAAGGEFLATKAHLMAEEDRTKSVLISRDYREFAKQDAKAMKKELQGNGKYNPAREILDARQILPGLLDKASRGNSWLLEFEDWLFLSPAYQNALGQALMHSGYSVEELQNTPDGQKALNNARRIAIQEAQKATYRDFSAIASLLNRIKRLESGSRLEQGLGLLVEGVLPFTKTPINILKRGVEYSPIGLIGSLITVADGVKNGNLDMATVIDQMAAGATGAAVMALGYLLRSIGWLRGKDDDEDEENYNKMLGYQDYSLQIGDRSVTIDWAAPTALPLFTGVALHDLMQGDEDLEWKDAWNAIMMIAEPMMSLSMLDGLNNTIASASYASDSEKLAVVGTSAFTSYLGQAFPTLGGQIARSLDGTRRTTYVDKNSPWPSAIQRFVQSSVQSKIPGWESKKTPYIDAWGREDTVGNKFLGGLENFLSPGYWNIRNVTDVDEEILRVHDATDADILPKTAAKNFKVNGVTKNLTAEEYVSFAKDVGSTKYTLLASLFSDPRYMRLDDTQKAKAIDYIYEYATAAGKYHVDNAYNIQAKWMREAEAAKSDYARFEIIWGHIEGQVDK